MNRQILVVCVCLLGYASALQADSLIDNTILDETIQLYQRGDYQRVIQRLHVTVEQPDIQLGNIDALLYLADAYFKVGKSGSTKRLLDAVQTAVSNNEISLDPHQNILFLSSLAMVHRQQGRLADAKQLLNKAMAFVTAPSNVQLSYLISGLYNELGLIYQAKALPGEFQYITIKTIEGLPKNVKHTLIVANVADTLHFRLFDESSNIVADKQEAELSAKSEQIADYKAALKSLGDLEKLSTDKKSQLIRQALSIIGHTAEQAFERALTLSVAHEKAFRASLSINLATLAVAEVQLDKIDRRLQQATAYLSALPDNTEKARLYLSLGDLYHQALKKEYTSDLAYRLSAFEHYRIALSIARTMANPELQSYAYGVIGLLYEEEERYEEAEHYGQQAIFHAQAADVRNSLYQWQWLIARVRAMRNELQGSSDMFEQAIFTFRHVLPSLSGSDTNLYRQVVAPLSYQYADLQLKRAALQPDQAEQEKILLTVRDLIENVKQAEIIDYFGGECELPDTKLEALDQLVPGTAVLYPILFTDRIVLLLTYPGGIKQFSSPVGLDELILTVRQFRWHIQTEWGTQDYLTLSKKLYDWLIAPLVPTLKQYALDTLVVVPDGPLRTIPFTALHDGQQYLISQYAIANTLGLSLIEPQALIDIPLKVYAGGLSEAVQGFPALPKVKQELHQISQRTHALVYENEHFTQRSIIERLSTGDYTVGHIATHSQFNRDHKRSYFLTYDSKFTLSMLGENMRERLFSGTDPLELLVLSACETAVGDDRAALGLAGVTLQSGVRSAIASLWSINDAASSELMDVFYAQLVEKSDSKARSLREAQLKLINDKRYQHPSHWAPFLLIGNWL